MSSGGCGWNPVSGSPCRLPRLLSQHLPSLVDHLDTSRFFFLFSASMARFDLLDIKKQASLYLREKFMDARLAFTDVSRIQLLTEEATNADPWGPETKTLALLSEAAYELEEYDRIVPVLQSRLEMIEKKPWRQVYKTLVVLEYLLTHGPGSLLHDFRSFMHCIEELCEFTFVDHQSVDRGLGIRKKADRVLELLSKTEVWKEERNRAQKLSHGIKGFGSNSMNKNTHHDAAESLERQVRSEDSVAEDPQSQSVLLPNEMVKDKEKEAIDDTKDSAAVWHSYEKCFSSPVQFREGDLSFPASNEFNPRMYHEHKNEFLAAWSPFKKTMSSPGFRDNASSTWQPFGHEIVRETDDAGSHLLQASEGHVQRAGKDEILTVDLDDAQHHGKTFHRRSFRHFFGLHRSLKDSTEMNSSEKYASPKSVAGSIESSDSRSCIQSFTKVDGSRGIEFPGSEPVNKLSVGQELQQLHGFAELPRLPPPPSKLECHLQMPSLIDL